MPWEEKDVAGAIIGGLTFIAAAVAAWATSKQFFLYRRSLVTSQPTVSAAVDLRVQGHPSHISVLLDAADRKAWRISSITVWPPFQALISEIGRMRQTADGGVAYYEPKKWRRRITFDPPIETIGLLTPPNAPRILQLRFVLESRSDARIKSRPLTRIKTRD